ncbi:cytochrome c550 [Sediminibacillus massiliensis]|uniref:cytochrome c550 n=1 Tax=Sediminibacillus massiliensis TaxID=1926277 RepID=UPI0009887D37|nr:cytochrome c [Sediminibacillus massiliensis]
MKRNPVIPYAIIAVLGILTMIVLSIVGLDQFQEIEQAGEEGGQQEESAEGGDPGDPEAIFQNNCASCHGADLSGGAGPNLQEVGSRYSQEEIHEIIMNGIEGTAMPGGLVSEEEANSLAEWLAEHQ